MLHEDEEGKLGVNSNMAYVEEGKNSQTKGNEFRQYLAILIKEEPKKYCYLLKNLPRFKLKGVPLNLNYAVARENYDAFLLHSEKPDAFILKFLRAGNYNFEIATKILVNYILLMRDHPKYYMNSVHHDVIQKVYDEKIHTVLPCRDKYRRRVFIWRPGMWNPDSVTFTDCYCAMYMLCELMAQEPITQVSGCTVVCEGSNIGFKQLKSMGMEDIRNCANFIQVLNATLVFNM